MSPTPGPRDDRPDHYLATLDGWRAIAILAVLACHATGSVATHDPGVWWRRLGRNGALGVDLFFAISGFLICSRLIDERHRAGRISLSAFYLRRAARILPPSLAYLAAISLLSVLGVLHVDRAEALSALALARNYLPTPAAGGWYTGHFWSLAIEEHFYLLLPTLMIVVGIPRARWLLPALALVVAAWRTLAFHAFGPAALLPGVSFYGRTDVRLDGLLWGCALALWLSRPAARAWLSRRLTPRAWLVLAVAFVGCVAMQPPLAMAWQAMLLPVLLAGTLLHPGGRAGRVLESRPLAWIGRLSYGLYLWQQLFLVDATLADEGARFAPWTLPLRLAAALALAWLSYRGLERPMVRLGHRLLAARPTPASSSAAPPTLASALPRAVDQAA